MTQDVEMTEAEQQAWVKEQYQVATKYLAEKGMVTNSVKVESSRYLVPILAIWQLALMNGERYWVLCGDLPTDHSRLDVAPNARDALKHFSLKWQLQADNLLKAEDKAQNDFAQLLIGRAEGLYQLCENENLWK
jgi:hypothetical protein